MILFKRNRFYQLPWQSLSKSVCNAISLWTFPRALIQPRPWEPVSLMKAPASIFSKATFWEGNAPPSTHSNLNGRLAAHLRVWITSQMTKSCRPPSLKEILKTCGVICCPNDMRGEGTQLVSDEQKLVMVSELRKDGPGATNIPRTST